MKVKEASTIAKPRYPYLGKHVSIEKNGGLGYVTYIKFTAPNTGVLIHTDRKEWRHGMPRRGNGMDSSYPFWPLATEWPECLFDVFEGTLEIRNDDL